MKTFKEVVYTSAYGSYTVPIGTPVMKIGNLYAVASIKDSIACGMSEHDAKHRYIFVPKDSIQEEEVDKCKP